MGQLAAQTRLDHERTVALTPPYKQGMIADLPHLTLDAVHLHWCPLIVRLATLLKAQAVAWTLVDRFYGNDMIRADTRTDDANCTLARIGRKIGGDKEAKAESGFGLVHGQL